MSDDKIVHKMGKAIARRKIFTRIGVGALGATFAFLALPKEAEATVFYKGCHLCKSPTSGSCCGAHAPYCAWAWTICYSGKKYRCTETYCSGGDCGGGCSGVNCSAGTLISNSC